jgi:hypothetical protein
MLGFSLARAARLCSYSVSSDSFMQTRAVARGDVRYASSAGDHLSWPSAPLTHEGLDTLGITKKVHMWPATLFLKSWPRSSGVISRGVRMLPANEYARLDCASVMGSRVGSPSTNLAWSPSKNILRSSSKVSSTPYAVAPSGSMSVGTQAISLGGTDGPVKQDRLPFRL